MSSRPVNILQHLLHLRLPAAANQLFRRTSRLPHRPALLAAAVPLVLAAALYLWSAHRLPGTPSPNATIAHACNGTPAAALPGYLAFAKGRIVPATAAQPLQLSARGGERPAASLPPLSPIPEPKRVTTYKAAAGDTVASLAERFSISAETIVWANSLAGTTASLQPGQELTILPVSGVLHRVRPGDTLNGIAQAYGVQAGAILEVNALAAPDLLAIGQPLVIPGGRPAPPATPRPAAAVPQLIVGDAGEATGKGAEIIAIAARYLGYPYVFGGSTPGGGFDCSGFSQYVYAQAGIRIPRDLPGQLHAGQAVQVGALLPGDLLFFQNTYTAGLSHIGIYVGGGRFIHAASEERGVTYDSLAAPFWTAHYYGANRPWQ